MHLLYVIIFKCTGPIIGTNHSRVTSNSIAWAESQPFTFETVYRVSRRHASVLSC